MLQACPARSACRPASLLSAPFPGSSQHVPALVCHDRQARANCHPRPDHASHCSDQRYWPDAVRSKVHPAHTARLWSCCARPLPVACAAAPRSRAWILPDLTKDSQGQAQAAFLMRSEMIHKCSRPWNASAQAHVQAQRAPICPIQTAASGRHRTGNSRQCAGNVPWTKAVSRRRHDRHRASRIFPLASCPFHPLLWPAHSPPYAPH